MNARITAEDLKAGYRKIFVRNKGSNRPNQVLQCLQCPKTYTKVFSIRAHIRMHRGEKPFYCEHCNRGFVQKCNLKRHLEQGCSMAE